MDNQIQKLIEVCKKGGEFKITEDSLMKSFPDAMTLPTDERRYMRKGMNEWLDRVEEVFGIEWVKIENHEYPTYYLFREIIK